MSTRKIYDAEIGDAIRQYVWDQCKVGGPRSLGLFSVNRGAQDDVQGPNPFTARLPCARVFFITADGNHNRERKSWEGKYTFLIHYLRALAEGEDVEAVTRPATSTIGQLFMQDPKWQLPGFSAVGCLLTWCATTRIHIEETGNLQEAETALGHGFITVMVHADSFLF